MFWAPKAKPFNLSCPDDEPNHDHGTQLYSTKHCRLGGVR